VAHISETTHFNLKKRRKKKKEGGKKRKKETMH